MAVKKKLATVSLNDIRIGILGGGQMAQMLTTRARQMGFNVTVLSQDKFDPAVSQAQQWIKGDIYSEIDIRKLAIKVDLLTYESEFIPVRNLQKAQTFSNVQIFPKLEHLAILQDRWPQKELLWDYQIPTAEFIKINGKDDLESAYKVFDGQFILKKRFGDHLSKTTIAIKNKLQFESFKRIHRNEETQYIAEKWINFKSEKTLIACRNQNSEIFIYPLFHCAYKDQQVFRVWGPDQHKGFTHLIDQLSHLLNEINYIGIITFELFDTGSELIVNEIVPRLHNAGHITQDAFSIDQFELHLRSMLNMNFPLEIQSTQKFLMQNIVGRTGRRPVIPVGLQGKLHWYNKKDNKPLKKLGHINYFGNSLKSLSVLADYDLRKIKS